MEIIQKALQYVGQYKLSDLHMHVNEPVAIRVDGDIQTFPDDVVTQPEIDGFIERY
jgi:Tfp pilus assembly pilus retraction ATPase PilT